MRRQLQYTIRCYSAPRPSRLQRGLRTAISVHSVGRSVKALLFLSFGTLHKPLQWRPVKPPRRSPCVCPQPTLFRDHYANMQRRQRKALLISQITKIRSTMPHLSRYSRWTMTRRSVISARGLFTVCDYYRFIRDSFTHLLICLFTLSLICSFVHLSSPSAISLPLYTYHTI